MLCRLWRGRVGRVSGGSGWGRLRCGVRSHRMACGKAREGRRSPRRGRDGGGCWSREVGEGRRGRKRGSGESLHGRPRVGQCGLMVVLMEHRHLLLLLDVVESGLRYARCSRLLIELSGLHRLLLPLPLQLPLLLMQRLQRLLHLQVALPRLLLLSLPLPHQRPRSALLSVLRDTLDRRLLIPLVAQVQGTHPQLRRRDVADLPPTTTRRAEGGGRGGGAGDVAGGGGGGGGGADDGRRRGGAVPSSDVHEGGRLWWRRGRLLLQRGAQRHAEVSGSDQQGQSRRRCVCGRG